MQKVLQNATPTSEGYDTKSPIFLGSKIFLALAREVHYIQARKKRFDMKNEVYVASDCCSVPMTQECAEIGICPRCLEHCEPVVEVVPIPE